MGFGAVEVIVPEDVCVSSQIDIGAGMADVFGNEYGDFDVDWSQRPDVSAGASELFIDAELDVGAIYVRHPSEEGFLVDNRRDRSPFGEFEDDDDTGPVAQEACE